MAKGGSPGGTTPTAPANWWQQYMLSTLAQPREPRQQGEGLLSMRDGGNSGIRTPGDLADQMRSGYAPPSVGGILSGLGNAAGLMGGMAPVFGARSLLSHATGMPFGGIENIEGQTPFDRDLVDSVRRAQTLGQAQAAYARAISEQGQRNTQRQAEHMAATQRANDASRHSPRGGGGGRDQGGGPNAGGMRGNTPSGADKPGPGGKVR